MISGGHLEDNEEGMHVCLDDIEQSDMDLLEDSIAEEMELNNNRGEETGASSRDLSKSLSQALSCTIGGGGVNIPRFQHGSPDKPPQAPMGVDKFFEIKGIQLSQCLKIRPLELSVEKSLKLGGFRQRLRNEQDRRLQELIRLRNEVLSERKEEEELRKRIAGLEGQLEEHKSSFAKIKKKYSGQLGKARADKEEYKKVMEKLERKKAKSEQKREEQQKHYDKVMEKQRKVMQKLSNQDECFMQFGLQLIVSALDESRTSVSDSTSPDSTTSNGSGSVANQLAIQLTNINPDDPKEVFYIQTTTISLAENTFKVHTILPGFDEAYDVSEEANESQDFIKLLLDCKKYWLRALQPVPTLINEDVNVNIIVADTSKALFESPTSEADASKDLFESPLSDGSVSSGVDK